ncbi:response regulator transcription factor [Bacillus sp. CGMCC 1.16607]|uniref:response regulator transcription factor n=1 Tax=Bacillus sp. CGMCC 1.16607 TaxID=3351842 RepID=UPI003632BA90
MEEILIVEDEIDIQKLLSLCFEQEGLKYNMVSTGEEALDYLESDKEPSLILLDVMLPGKDGFNICEEIRKITCTPIILMSCKNGDHDKVYGFSVGADDYIEKPFRLNVLIARVRAHLRRNRILSKYIEIPPTPISTTSTNKVIFDNIEIDLQAREVLQNGKEIHLTSKEYDLLIFLYTNKNQVFPAEDLLYHLCGEDTNSEIRTVIVHISSLRKKLEENSLNPKYIVTVRGVGYKFVLKD